MRRLLVYTVIVSLMGGVASGLVAGIIEGSATRASISAVGAHQRRQLIAAEALGCRRRDALQAAANRNALATYRFDALFAAALVRPQPGRTQRQRALAALFRARLLDITRTLVWTPLNHACVASPLAVQLPVAFATRIPGAADLRAPSASLHG